MGDIARRHPRGMIFETDAAYTALANRIYDIIRDKVPTDFTRREVIEISADVAAYCEDVVSGTHLFEAFASLYNKMFHYRLPFYNDRDYHDGFCLNSLRFAVWHGIESQSLHRIINPLNHGVEMLAQGILELLNTKLDELPANEGLAEFLYSEETQTDPIEVKKVLMWLMYDCYLGRWESHESEESTLRQLLGNKVDNRFIDYANRSLCALQYRTWPLSLKPQTIYAEMIKIDMDDEEDELASAIAQTTMAPAGMYHIMGCDNKTLTVQDHHGTLYAVSLSSFDYNPQSEIRSNLYTDVIASFMSMDGKTWHVNGMCSFLGGDDKDFKTYSKGIIDAEESAKARKHQFDDFIKAKHGERLFFFMDRKAYARWLEMALGLKNVQDVNMDLLPEGQPMLVFIEPSGNMSINFYPECIKHPANPFYDPIKARETALQMIGNAQSYTTALVQHLIKNQLLPDAMLNDARGMRHGTLLLQENIEFLFRCIRRDIDTDEPFTTRSGALTGETSNDISGKLSYNDFIDDILEMDDFVSRANKLWYVIDASETITTIKNERGDEFNIPTRELYEAHLVLSEVDIINKNVEPFISLKKNVPAATALLYNIVGRGRSDRFFRETVKNIFKNELRKRR